MTTDEDTLRTNRVFKIREEWTIDGTDADDDSVAPAIVLRRDGMSIVILPVWSQELLHIDAYPFNDGAAAGTPVALTVTPT